MNYLAQNLDNIQKNSGLGNQPTDIGSFITSSNLMDYVFGAAGLILLIMLLTAGYQYMFAKGDPKAMQIAQSRITSSLIGIVLLFAAFWIVRIIGMFLGLPIFEEVFG